MSFIYEKYSHFIAMTIFIFQCGISTYYPTGKAEYFGYCWLCSLCCGINDNCSPCSTGEGNRIREGSVESCYRTRSLYIIVRDSDLPWVAFAFTWQFFMILVTLVSIWSLINVWSITEAHLHVLCSLPLLCDYRGCSYFGAHFLLYPSVWADKYNVLCWCLFPSWFFIGNDLSLHN